MRHLPCVSILRACKSITSRDLRQIPATLPEVILLQALSGFLIVTVLAACAPSATPGGNAEATRTQETTSPTVDAEPTIIEALPTKEADLVVVQVTGGTATLDVTSPSGIGGAAVEVVSGPFPAAVIFRLHLKGLEQFTLTYGDVAVFAAVASDGSRVSQSVMQNGREQQITPESPYWMPVEVITAAAGGSTEKVFQLSAPPDFLETQPPTFAIQWIDFFR